MIIRVADVCTVLALVVPDPPRLIEFGSVTCPHGQRQSRRAQHPPFAKAASPRVSMTRFQPTWSVLEPRLARAGERAAAGDLGLVVDELHFVVIRVRQQRRRRPCIESFRHTTWG